MTEPSVSFAGNLTDQPEVRYTEAGIARAIIRVAVSGRRDGEASFFTVVVWRDQAEHAAQSLSRGSRVVVMGRLQQRSWTTEDGSPDRWSRSWPRSWGQACVGQPPGQSASLAPRASRPWSTRCGGRGWGTLCQGRSRVGWPSSTPRNMLPVR
jgi:hypothetical protein